MKLPDEEERRRRRLRLAALEQLRNPASLGLTPMVEDRRGQPPPWFDDRPRAAWPQKIPRSSVRVL